ncbi:4Fe-4S binding protein [Clostridium sp.]|uniref:4Fe-4S binding protein n=1 Tax=Clostridium sp. TaxID=1506 RepID=UPI002FCB5BE9
MGEYYIKTNRIFTRVRSYIWILTPLVAIGGIFEKKLGLLIPPIMLTLIVMSFFRGRYWCGNFCSHGSFYDKYLLKISRNKKIYDFLNSKIVMVVFFTWFMFNITRKLIAAVNSFGTSMFLDDLGYVFTSAYLMVLVLGGLISIINSPRAWCKVCPMGIMQKGSYKLGDALNITTKTDRVLTIDSKSKCHLCGKCARVCPMQLEPYLNFDSDNRFISNECIKCSTCVKNCPASILSFENNHTHLVNIKKREKSSIIDMREENEGTITKINKYSHNVIGLEIKLNSDIEKIPGGYILLKIQDSPLQYRAYTVAKYIDDNTLEVIIKLEEKGYGTNIIFKEFREGYTTTIKGPIEGEISKIDKVEKALFIAGGIGFTPFIELINRVLKEDKGEVTMLHAARYEGDLIYNNYFEEVGAKENGFKYIPVLSRDKNTLYDKGSVVEKLQDIKDIKDYKIYVCSSNRLANSIEEKLISLGVDKENLFIESL